MTVLKKTFEDGSQREAVISDEPVKETITRTEVISQYRATVILRDANGDVIDWQEFRDSDRNVLVERVREIEKHIRQGDKNLMNVLRRMEAERLNAQPVNDGWGLPPFIKLGE